ncbi:MAG: NAD-dependent epimerase/dehydratase family protein [Promethearchaeota archaeon]
MIENGDKLRILITGGKGFIGSKIIEFLTNLGHEIIVYDLVCKDEGQGDVEYIKGDIFDSECLSDSLKGSDLVIHMIGQPNARLAQENPQQSYELNVGSVQTLLDSMRKSNINRIILPSSAAIYGTVTGEVGISEDTPANPQNIYAYHKWIAEEVCRSYSQNYSINSVILRLFNVYGPSGSGIINILINKAKNNEVLLLYGEEQLRDFIHLDDVALVFSKVINCKDCTNQTINVGTGSGRSVNEIVDLVKESFPEIQIKRKEFKGNPYDSFADITKLNHLLGFTPDGSIERLKRAIKEMI